MPPNESTYAYLSIGPSKIPGESTDGDHRDWIEVRSFKLGVFHSGDGTVGRTSRKDLEILKEIDAASPLLAIACASGQLFKKVFLEIRRVEKKIPFIRYVLLNVMVTGVEPSADYRTDPHSPEEKPRAILPPQEKVTLSYGQMYQIYTKLDAEKTAGSTSRIAEGWDFEKNGVFKYTPDVDKEISAGAPLRG